jgi:hypothetical protein
MWILRATPGLVALSLLLGWPGRLAGADVGYYGLIKSQMYLQTNNSTPSLKGTNAFAIAAFVIPSSSYAVTNATFTPQGKPIRSLLLDSNGTSLRFEFATNSQANLDALFPSPSFGSPMPYSFTLQTVNDGFRTAAVTLPNLLGSPIQPPLVNVQDVPQLQTVDHTLDLLLRWSASGGNALQIIQALIIDGSSNLFFATPAPFTAGALSGTSNSVVVPAGTLPPGQPLELHLTIAQPGLPNTNDYPGAIGVGAFAKDTAVPITTRPAPPPPKLSLFSLPTNAILVHVEAESNRLCHLEASLELNTWTNLLSTNTGSGIMEYLERKVDLINHRFYRARIGQ